VEEQSTNQNTGQSSFLSFFSKPIVGILGSIASIIGIFLAIFFYVNSIQTRELTCYVHPAKTIIARAGQVSRLSYNLDDKPIKTDITAAQIAFWNSGNLSIRPENMLSPFRLKLENATPIIEATIRKQSREVINLKLKQDRLEQGEFGIDCDILEKNDGGVIQIIYAGSSEVDIIASGVVEAQGNINQPKYFGKILSPSEQYQQEIKRNRNEGIILVIMSCILLTGTLFLQFRMLITTPKNYKLRKVSKLFFLFPYIVICLAFIGAIVRLFFSTPKGPPFGF
jgi:hypothetical protein